MTNVSNLSDEVENVRQDLEFMKIAAARLCKSGYRMSVMMAVEEIIKENRLDRFAKLEAAE
jgi:hypothetical protein